MNTPSNFTNLDLIDVEERRELLNAYIDGELSAEEALHVSGWLDDNAGALREVEHLRHIGDLLESYEDEPVPADFAANVIAGVGAVSGGTGERNAVPARCSAWPGTAVPWRPQRLSWSPSAPPSS